MAGQGTSWAVSLCKSNMSMKSSAANCELPLHNSAFVALATFRRVLGSKALTHLPHCGVTSHSTGYKCGIFVEPGIFLMIGSQAALKHTCKNQYLHLSPLPVATANTNDSAGPAVTT
jgi:hypothetical protein